MSQNKKKIRDKFREDVFSRDKHRCKMCGEPAVDSHHIVDRTEMPNGGYVKENGISLCSECHIKAEKFHITNGQEWEPGFHPDELFAKISSSKEIAIQKAKKLCIQLK